MKLFKWRKSSKKQEPAEAPQQEVVDEVIAPIKKTINIVKIPRVSNPSLSFKSRPGTETFEQPEYDLAEIGRIEDVESFVRRAFRYKEGLMFKEGWEFTGSNLKTINYIKQRFRQIDQATGMSHKLMIRGIGADLVRFSNAYIVKVRKEKASGGSKRSVPGRKKKLEPVAGYFPIPPTTVRIKRDEHGKVSKYRQFMPNGFYKDFNADDVIHFFFDRKKGFLVGTPSLIPVKDDIRALRRIEENIELLIYQNLFPLFHYKVGTENAPAREYPDGSREVDIIKAEIQDIPAEGAIVTPERHEITAIGSEGRALRAEGYLQHFKQRVFAGLGVSAVDMGEGSTANRSTADSMSRNMVDDVKAMQREVELFINEFMIKELLLESTFPNPLDEDNIVYMQFREIDLDSQIKKQNHYMEAFSAHAITHPELRKEFSKEPFTEEDEAQSYWKKYDEPKLLIQAVDEPYSAIAKAAAKSQFTAIEQGDLNSEATARKKEMEQGVKAKAGGQKPGPASTKKSSGQRAAAAKNRPSNQYGKKQGPEKRKSSFNYTGRKIKDMIAAGNKMTDIYDDLLHDTIRAVELYYYDENWFKSTALAASTLMQNRLLATVRTSFREGFRATQAEYDYMGESYPFSILTSRITRLTNRLVVKLGQQLKRLIDINTPVEARKTQVIKAFDALHFRSRFIYNSEKNKAYNYGVALGLRKQGRTEAEIYVSENACDICKKHVKIISLEHILVDDLPGFHPNCTCHLVIK